MDRPQAEWTVAGAITPFVLTFLFLFVSLIHLSFPKTLSRIPAAFSVTLLAGAAFAKSDQLFPDSYAEEIYLRFVIIYLSYFLYLCLEKEKERTRGEPGLHNALNHPPQSPWGKGYKLLFNCRGIAAQWELPYLGIDPNHTKRSENRKKATSKHNGEPTRTLQSRWCGVAPRCAYLALNFILLCIYYEYLDLAGYVGLRPSDTTREKESIVRRALGLCFGFIQEHPITQRELVVRLWAVFDLVVPDYLILSAYHDFFAIFFIVTGLDESWEWPPLFGPITEAYNVRRYWSIFWHRLVYMSFSGHAAKVLGTLGHDRRTYRLLRNSLVFVLSAIMHGVVSWRLGNQCAFDRHLSFWLLQPLAFVLEGLVTACWKRWKAWFLPGLETKTVARFETIIGYVWVIMWLFWCAPKGRLPILFCGRK